jgi:site-specific DNA recombinase
MRCATYARFSSDLQHPSSIDDQILACQRYAEHQGWDLVNEHLYTDEALSGMGIQHRPSYQRLLQAVSASTPPFDVLLVDDLSRLSRDTAEILRFVRLLQARGVRLVSVADGIETGTKVAKLVLSVKAIMNEAYLDDLRDRTLRGLQGRFARKLHTGGRIFGYRSTPVMDPTGRLDSAGSLLRLGAKLVLEPEEGQIVEQIYSWFAEGLSLRAIADRLNREKMTFPSQSTQRGLKRKGWASSGVRVILKNEKYIGRWIYGRRVFNKDPISGRRLSRVRPQAEWQVAEYPELRIISDNLWQTVQERFHKMADRYQTRDKKGRLIGRKIGATSDRSALFSGLLQCGTCGGGLTAVSGSRRGGTQRFGCGFHRNKGPEICPNDLTVKARILETKLLEAIRRTVLEPEALTYLVSAVNLRLKQFSASLTHEREGINGELRQVDKALHNIEQAILSGMTGETTGELLKNFEKKRKDLRAKLVHLESQTPVQPLSVKPATIHELIKDLESLLNTDPTRVNAFFRKHFSPIICTPEKANGQRFYRARGAARGQELLVLFGIETPFAIGGCGGGI